MERIESVLKELEDVNIQGQSVPELLSHLVNLQELSNSIERAKIVSLGSGSSSEMLACYAARVTKAKTMTESQVSRCRELSMSQNGPLEGELLRELVPPAPKAQFAYVEDMASEPSFPVAPEPVTYWNYILPRELCDQMHLYSPNHDEHLFVRVHQVFELWFNQVLYELAEVRARMIGAKAPAADASYFAVQRNLQRLNASLRRSDAIVRHATTIFDVLETMEPADFLDFRDFLGTASGFQSTQFRELELLLGVGNGNRPKAMGQQWEERFNAERCPMREQRILGERKGEVSLRRALEQWLNALHMPNLDAFVRHFMDVKKTNLGDDAQFENVYGFFFEVQETDYYKISLSYTKNPEELEFRRRALYVFTWREHPRWALVNEALGLVQRLELALTIWRHRHARLVEYMIGRRTGTGGSSGVAYLDASTGPSMRVFGDLVRVRGEAIAKEKLKGIDDEGYWHEK